MRLDLRKAGFITVLCLAAFMNRLQAIEYSQKKTIEIAGQATASYTSAPRSQLSTNFFALTLQPTVSYFLLDTWYVGAGIQGNLTYSSVTAAWFYYGDFSVLGGKTINLTPSNFLFGQFEVGSSMPYVQDNSIQSRYFYFRPAIGLKFILNSAVITTSLKYTWTQIKNSFDPDYYASHNLQLGVGIGFYF